jgi:uncharacterized phage protein (TIGR02218 family)
MYSHLTAASRALLSQKWHRQATCWQLERADGTILRFTDNATPLVFNGSTFTPTAGLSASARERQAGAKVHNLEVQGVLASNAITHDDIRAGLYDNAQVTEYLIDWRYPWAGAIVTNVYWITGLRYTSEGWEASLESVMRRLQRVRGSTYRRSCRYELGSTDCGVTLATYTEAATVTDVSGAGLDARRTFLVAGPAEAAGFYDLGYIEWLTGANAGLVSQVKAFTAGPLKVVVQLKTPFALEVGDTGNLVAGCDKLSATCIAKFDNLVNFGGFPFLPGNDKMLETPGAT